MRGFRASLATVVCASLIVVPIWGSPINPLGIIVSAYRAHVSDAAASAGATIYGGDRLVTETGGALQIRTSTSRLYLSESSSASVSEGSGTPQVTLFSGTAVSPPRSARVSNFFSKRRTFVRWQMGRRLRK